MKHINDLENYIYELELAQPKYLIMDFGGAIAPQSFEVYVDHSSIVKFDSDILTQYKKDVLNSQLLAQLAADNHAKGDIYKWYGKYKEVLTKIGWVEKERWSVKNEIVGNKMTVQKVVLDALAAVVPKVTAIQLIDATLGALEALKASNEKIRLFEKSSHTEYAANFQASTSYKAENEVQTALCIICLNTKAKIDSIIGIDLSKLNTTLNYKANVMVLNDDVHDKLRDLINGKLEDATGAISEIEI